MIARSVGRSVDKALGEFYLRIQGRRDGLVANIALERKLAQLFWRLMVHGRAYLQAGLKNMKKSGLNRTMAAAQTGGQIRSATPGQSNLTPLGAWSVQIGRAHV